MYVHSFSLEADLYSCAFFNSIDLDMRFGRWFLTTGVGAELFEPGWIKGCHQEFIDRAKRLFLNPIAPPPPPILSQPRGYSGGFSIANSNLLRPQGKTRAAPDTIYDEIRRYEAEEVMESGGDPLDWWKLNGSRFPTLARMARIFLAMPGKLFIVQSRIQATNLTF